MNPDGFGWIAEETYQQTKAYWVHCIDRCGHPDLLTFINEVFTRTAEVLSDAYLHYWAACTKHGTQESAATDLEAILTELGEEYDKNKFAEWKAHKVNESPVSDRQLLTVCELAIELVEKQAIGVWEDAVLERWKD